MLPGPLLLLLSPYHPSITGSRFLPSTHSALFRHTPRWLDGLLDGLLGGRWLLRRVGRRASSTDPAQLGPLTVSMLRGDHGRQKKELDKLCRWLEREVVTAAGESLGRVGEVRRSAAGLRPVRLWLLWMVRNEVSPRTCW